MDSRATEPAPFRLGIVPIPGFALMSYASTVEPLRAANLLAGSTLYHIRHYGWSDQSLSSCGAGIATVTPDPRDPEPDLLLVIAGGDPGAFKDARLTNWLRRTARRGVRIGGVSGGPVILANAGLMNGHRMTVHWEHAPELAEQNPELMIEKRLYIIDRDRVTCGGGTAPMEMMHAIIASHHGPDFARLVSDWFLHTDIRASAAPQRSGLAERLGTRTPRVLDAVAAMEDHVGDPLSLDQLALIAGVTPRQLNRVFQHALGVSTMAYYRRIRLETARRLLSATSMPVSEIAGATGFASAAHFSAAFSKAYRQPPSSIRNSLASAADAELPSAPKETP